MTQELTLYLSSTLETRNEKDEKEQKDGGKKDSYEHHTRKDFKCQR